MAKYKISDFAYNGKYHDYCWNIVYNPNATIENGLANCTTLAYAFSYIHHLPRPVSRIVSASAWQKVLVNGWKRADYGSVSLKVGDIVQWVDKVHVATVIDIKKGDVILGASWYTGEHGVAYYDGQYDTRNEFNSLQQLSDFMIEKYPYRFYHECSLNEEIQKCGGMPENILVAPVGVEPVEEDRTRNQIHVLTNEQNIRDDENEIVSVAKEGYYNVLNTRTDKNLIWYEIAENRWIAGVNGRVVFIPAESEIDTLKAEIERLRTENEKYLKKLQLINEESKI